MKTITSCTGALICVIFISVCAFGIGDFLIRETLYGQVRGSISSRIHGMRVEEFLGVPYASAPIRFQRADEPTPWTPNILNTTSLPSACIQYSVDYIDEHKPYWHKYSEDCLYMNIYVPMVNNSPLPVLLYIHGGSNTVGMGAMFDGDILAAHGQIIVITFNYRLGALGFYADRSEGIEGNNGLLDQIKAMEWVQDNIKFFNGDPSRVTIYGHSAGAGSVGLHLISKLSKGLFRNAIVHSGSPLALWGISECVLTSRVNCIPSDCRNGSSRVTYRPTYEQLMDRTAINNFIGIPGESMPLNILTFLPVKDDFFLHDSPEKLLKCSPVNAESVLIMMARDELFPTYEKSIPDSIKFFVRTTLDFRTTFGEQVLDDMDRAITEWMRTNVSRYPEEDHLVADAVFFSPMIKLADHISKGMESVYLLSFEYVSQHLTGPSWQGVPHGWDLFYVFGVPLVGHELHKYTERDVNVSKTTMQLISNYVKYGYLTTDGTDKLAKYNSTIESYNKLHLLNNQVYVTKEKHFRKPRIEFWDKYLFPYDYYSCNEENELNITICNNSCKVNYYILLIIISVITSLTQK